MHKGLKDRENFDNCDKTENRTINLTKENLKTIFDILQQKYETLACNLF